MNTGQLKPALIVNAGGQSRRMGRPKALLPTPPDGRPLIAHVVRRLARLNLTRLIVVTNDPDMPAQAGLPLGTIYVPDAYPGTGTLGGIATGLQQVGGWAIVVACDLPLVSADLFELLSGLAVQQDTGGERWDAVVPIVGGYEEPLHALYHRRCLPAIEARLAQGERRVISFLGEVRTCYVPEAELRRADPLLHSFVNANTPQEWQAALPFLDLRQDEVRSPTVERTTDTMRARTPVDLEQYLTEERIEAQLIHDIGHTPTVPAAAAVLGVEADQIIKTLLFLIEPPDPPGAAPVVVISNGERRIDKRKLAERFGVNKKRVSLAAAETVLATLGYPAGGVPPFGHITAVPVLVDASVASLETRYGGVIFGGGGDDRTMMRLTVAELLRVTGAELAEVS